MRKLAYKDWKPSNKHPFNYLLDLDFIGGLMLILIAWITDTKIFSGRRITAMVLCILFLTFWDILWVSFTDIEMDLFSGKTGQTGSYFKADQLDYFDSLMF